MTEWENERCVFFLSCSIHTLSQLINWIRSIFNYDGEISLNPNENGAEFRTYLSDLSRTKNKKTIQLHWSAGIFIKCWWYRCERIEETLRPKIPNRIMIVSLICVTLIKMKCAHQSRASISPSLHLSLSLLIWYFGAFQMSDECEFKRMCLWWN